MKIKNFEPKPYEEMTIRIGGATATFRAAPVTDLEVFEKQFPMPVPPKKIAPDKTEHLNMNDPEYRKNVHTWAEARTVWLIAKSLSATEDLTWSKLDLNSYETLTIDGLSAEFEQAKIPDAAASKIINMAKMANALTDDYIVKAQEDFLPVAAPTHP